MSATLQTSVILGLWEIPKEDACPSLEAGEEVDRKRVENMS
jgi:hypothetical protein